MNPKFKANGVLANAVDYFCLVCESHLYNEIDAVTHIGKPVHTKNFELTNYFENRDDCVRKIKKWYFCELCNLLLSTATKVRLHITEIKHIEFKNERLLERNGKFVVAFSNVQIHDRAWNGIIDETCVICNTEFEDEKIHVNETDHIIKLIQSKTQFDANKNVYRKTDDSSIQCLTCNTVFALCSFDAHFNLPEHIKLYQEAIKSIEDTTLENNNKANNGEDETVNCKLIQDTISQDDKKTNSSKDENVNNKPIQDTLLQNENNAKDDNVNNKPIQDSVLQNYKKLNIPKDENLNNKPIQDAVLQNDKNANNRNDENLNNKPIQDTVLQNDKNACNAKNGNVTNKPIQDTVLQSDKKANNAKDSNVHNKPIQDTILQSDKKVNNAKDGNVYNKPIQDTVLQNDKKANNAKDSNVHNKPIQDTILQSDKKVNNAKDGNVYNKPIQDTVLQNDKKANNAKDSNVHNKPIQDTVLQNDKETNNVKSDIINNKQNKDPKKEVTCRVTETNNIRKNVDEECHKKKAKPVKITDKEICEILDAKDYIIKQRNGKLLCILCNWDMDHATVKNHVNGKHHETILKFHNKRLAKLNANQITSSEAKNTITQAENIHVRNYEEGVGILDSIEIFYQNGIQINYDNHTAFCVKCSSSLNFNKAFIENHIEHHIENHKVDDIKKGDDTNKNKVDEDESILDCIENFQKNNIQINFENQTASCKKCSTFLEFKKNIIENHIEEHKKSLKAKDKIEQSDTTIKQKNDERDQMEIIMESIDDFQKNEIVINLELQIANCIKCSTSLDFNKEVIDNHIKGHTNTCVSEKKKTALVQVTPGIENRRAKNKISKKALKTPAVKKTDQVKQPAVYSEGDIKKIVEENDMTYTPNSREVHCNKCNTKIPCFPTNLNEHIEGSTHKAKILNPVTFNDKNKSIPKEIKSDHNKVPLNSFITSFVTVDGMLNKDIVINNTICINILSFALLSTAGNTLTCTICDTTENIDRLETHLDLVKHRTIANDSLVVDGDEFIREVQDIGFHCGYCNIFQTQWEDMERHMQSFVHKDSKVSSQWRLQQYLPHIQKHYFENRDSFRLHLVFNVNNED